MTHSLGRDETFCVTSGVVSVYRIPTDQPEESDGTAVWDSTTLVLVELRCGDHTGVGFTFMGRFGEPINTSSASIAKSLGRISYADAEQFCLDVRRRQVLSVGEKSLKSIIAEQLKIWLSETRARQTDDREVWNASASATASSES